MALTPLTSTSLNSVAWTDFGDPTLTATQISALQTSTQNCTQEASLLTLAASQIGSSFTSGTQSNPATIYKSLADAQAAVNKSTTAAAAFTDAAGAIQVVYYIGNGSNIYVTNPYSSYKPFNGQVLPMGTPPAIYAAYANEAAAKAAAQNGPNASAYSYVASNGSVAWAKRDWAGNVSTGSTEMIARMKSDGFSQFFYRTADPSLPTVTLGDLINAVPLSGAGSSTPSDTQSVYAQFGSAADAKAYLTQSNVANATAITYYNAATKTVQWATKGWAGSVSVPDTSFGNVSSTSFTTVKNNGYTTINALTNPLSVSTINTVLGTSYTAASTFTSAQITTLIAALKDKANSNLSNLPAGSGGGVQYYNGQWYANGSVTNFFDIFLAVRVNQIKNIEQSNVYYINAIQKRNDLINQANYFLSQINAIEPKNSDSTATDGKVSYTKIADGTTTTTDNTSVMYAFKYKYGYDPFTKFMPVSWAAAGTKDANGKLTTGSFTLTQIEAWASEIKSFTSAQQTNNSTDQTQLEVLVQKKTEVTDSISTIIKNNGQMNTSISKNLA